MERIERFTKPASEIRPDAVKLLNDPETTSEGREKQIERFMDTYEGDLSRGARQLLQLLGWKMIRREESRIVLLVEAEDAIPSSADVAPMLLGDRLKQLADGMAATEQLLKGYPTIGGKIRDLKGLDLGTRFYPRGYELFEGDGEPVLLWPVRDSRELAATVIMLAEHTGGQPQDFRLSIGISGRVGDDLKLAALAVHALTPYPYNFPKEITSRIATFKWFAPVVEGSAGDGNMNHIDLNGKGESLPSAGSKRYDHLFLRFVIPPTLEWVLSRKGRAAQIWRHGVKKFLARGKPTILSLDRSNRSIHGNMEIEGQAREFVWYPASKDWEAMVPEVGMADEEGFSTRLALEFMRYQTYQDLGRVVDAAWVLGLLREVRLHQADGVIPFGKGFTQEKRRQLDTLAQTFEHDFAELLENEGLEKILATPWVENQNWPRIHKEMLAYQTTLAANPHFQRAIRKLVSETVAAVRVILGLP